MKTETATITITGFSILLVIAVMFFTCTFYKDMRQLAPDPFAKCVHLPSSDKVDYWRCEK